MIADASTLRDLDIVPTPGRRGTTLWALIDRTRSRAGARALRQRFLTGPGGASEIVALQRAHAALASEATYRTLIDAADLDGVDSYLTLTWQLPASMPRMARFRTWHRSYLQDIVRGRACVAGLFVAAIDVAGRLRATDEDALHEMGDGLDDVLGTAAVRQLRALTANGDVRGFDQVARGDAGAALRDIVQRLATIEAMWSLGAATIEQGWSYPVPAASLCVTGLVHPFLGDDGVPNDLELDAAVRVCFVTGPNMAGKSTFLKAVAIAVVLAHAGCGVPATSMTFTVVSAVFSSVNVEDALGARESLYLAEVRRIGALGRILSDGRTALACLDEPFRGTNVHDAAEATLAVLTRLADHPRALVFVASHLSELAPAVADHAAVALLHFAADITADAPRFDYRIRQGVSNQRLGMYLLRQEGVLELLSPPTERDERQDARSVETPC